MIIGIEHVSMASDDFTETLKFFEQFGLQLSYTEDLERDGVRVRQMDAGNASIEILEPLRADSPVHKFLATRGAGLHHVCFRVDDLEATVSQMLAAGLQLVSPQPREDGQGRRVFLHPRSAHGALMGFVERHPNQGVSNKRTVNPGWRAYDRLTFVPAAASQGELLFISGLNSFDDTGNLVAPGDLVGQTRAVYEKMATILAAAGGSMADVVKTTDYILSRDNYAATADVRREFLGPNFPAATGVVVKELLGRGVLIEIDAVAGLKPRA